MTAVSIASQLTSFETASKFVPDVDSIIVYGIFGCSYRKPSRSHDVSSLQERFEPSQEERNKIWRVFEKEKGNLRFEQASSYMTAA